MRWRRVGSAEKAGMKLVVCEGLSWSGGPEGLIDDVLNVVSVHWGMGLDGWIGYPHLVLAVIDVVGVEGKAWGLIIL